MRQGVSGAGRTLRRFRGELKVDFRIAPHVAWHRLEDEAVIIDIPERTAIGLNPSGTYVWGLIEDHDLEGIAARVADHFRITPERALSDVTALLEELRSRGLVEEAE